ncbi:MAG: fasciclin domain-containing protein [Nocardioidaceae bacterium]
MRIPSVKTFAVTACAVALLGAVGCSSNNNDSTGGTGVTQNTDPTTSATNGTPDMSAQLVGSGCAAYADAVPDGPGSVSGMAQDPVATAASNNPLLKTLVAAVSGQVNPKVNLVDTLNGGEFTVFAPVDDAFAKLPKATVAALAKPANSDTLTSILTYHVLPGQIAPDKIVGSHTTVQGEDLKVTGSGDNLQVNGANVICGGVQTANATVYLIDGVMTPPSMS